MLKVAIAISQAAALAGLEGLARRIGFGESMYVWGSGHNSLAQVLARNFFGRTRRRAANDREEKADLQDRRSILHSNSPFKY
jgi:hypothetical protein